MPAQLYTTSLRLYISLVLMLSNMTLAVCLLQDAGTHPLYCCTVSLCREREEREIPSLYTTGLGLHLSYSHTFLEADAAMVMMKE